MRYYTSCDLLFLHIPKTAGTSVLELLNEQIGGYVLIDANYHHKKLSDVYNDIVRENTKIFTFIRSPFDLAVSLYEWFKTTSSRDLKYPHKGLAKKYSFKDWLVVWYKDNYVPTAEYILINNEIMKELTILKFENLKEDLDNYLNKKLDLNIDLKGLKHIYKTKRKSWPEYYDEPSKKIVREKCIWVLENFYPELL